MSEISNKPRAELGCLVELELLSRSGERERLNFDLVSDEQADYQAGFLGASTPIAQAILGERTGITIPYFTAELMAIKILSVRESTRKPAADAASQREAALNDAREQIEFTNAMLFAASVDTKWGSYDADGLNYDAWRVQRSKGDEKKQNLSKSGR